MTSFFRSRAAAASLAAAAVAGGGIGAGVYAATSGSGTHSATTEPVVAAAPIKSTATLSVGQINANDAQSVVEILVTSDSTNDQTFPFGGDSQQQALGSGFVYDTDGHIVTNQHVVDGATSVRVKFADGSTYKASVVGGDASTDVAVIKADAPSSKLKPLTFADSSKVAVGDGVVAIGSPFGLENTVTTGIVSAVKREISAPDGSPIENAIQTDAAINHGNSGGPLLDLEGHVVGITSQIESDTGGSDGVGFAVPANTVKSVATQLIASGAVQHAFLGVNVQTIPSNVADTIGDAAGVAVSQVQDGSAAAKANLKASTASQTVDGQSYPTGGDVITKLDGAKVTSAEQLRSLIEDHKPGDKVELTVVNGGNTQTVTVTLGSRSTS